MYTLSNFCLIIQFAAIVATLGLVAYEITHDIAKLGHVISRAIFPTVYTAPQQLSREGDTYGDVRLMGHEYPYCWTNVEYSPQIMRMVLDLLCFVSFDTD